MTTLLKTKVALLLILTSFQLFSDDWDKRVYIASYPKAGNHWVRFLIEEVSGVATSSVYCDQARFAYEKKHLETMFPWGYCPENGFSGKARYPEKDEFVFIKTHFPAFRAEALDQKPYLKTIRIIRHPIDTFYSAHTRNKPPGERVEAKVLQRFILDFRKFQEYWDNHPNVITIRYEDLYTNTSATLKKVLDEVGYTAQEGDIQRALAKHPPQGGILKYKQYFDQKDLDEITTQLGDIMQLYGYTSNSISTTQ